MTSYIEHSRERDEFSGKETILVIKSSINFLSIQPKPKKINNVVKSGFVVMAGGNGGYEEIGYFETEEEALAFARTLAKEIS